MKNFTALASIIALNLFVPRLANAAVNLDQQVNVSNREILFKSADESNVVYMMPNALNRLSDIRSTVDGRHLMVHFSVGILDAEIRHIGMLLNHGASSVTPIRPALVRALSAELVMGTDIQAKYRAHVIVAGDINNLAGPTDYVLELDRYAGGTLRLVDQLFGKSGADNVASLRIKFSAVAIGKPYVGTTVIPIFVGTKPIELADGVLGLAIGALSSTVTVSSAQGKGPVPLDIRKPSGLVVQRNVETHCADQSTVGVICLEE